MHAGLRAGYVNSVHRVGGHRTSWKVWVLHCARLNPRGLQEVWFDAQVALAKELRRPLFLHCRDAADRFIHILR